jgi:hypothetical protein
MTFINEENEACLWVFLFLFSFNQKSEAKFYKCRVKIQEESLNVEIYALHVGKELATYKGYTAP